MEKHNSHISPPVPASMHYYAYRLRRGETRAARIIDADAEFANQQVLRRSDPCARHEILRLRAQNDTFTEALHEDDSTFGC